MSENASDLHRQQQLYWNEMINLKADASYIRLYRDSRGRWVKGLGIFKAVASSSSIAIWAVWEKLPLVWGTIIAVSQVLDATKDFFPFAKEHKAASAYSMTLDYLFNDVQLEWESIFSGRYTDDEIMKLRHKLGKSQLDALQRNFPDGLAVRNQLLVQAKQEAETYFGTTYGVN
ncbi:MAG: hypothetical protein ABSA48_03355 [Terracidiphilus sp.]|jgi:hypothetical protein